MDRHVKTVRLWPLAVALWVVLALSIAGLVKVAWDFCMLVKAPETERTVND